MSGVTIYLVSATTCTAVKTVPNYFRRPREMVLAKKLGSVYVQFLNGRRYNRWFRSFVNFERERRQRACPMTRVTYVNDNSVNHDFEYPSTKGIFGSLLGLVYVYNCTNFLYYAPGVIYTYGSLSCSVSIIKTSRLISNERDSKNVGRFLGEKLSVFVYFAPTERARGKHDRISLDPRDGAEEAKYDTPKYNICTAYPKVRKYAREKRVLS